MSLLASFLHRVRHPGQTLQNGLIQLLLVTGRAGERVAGPRFVAAFVWPLVVLDVMRRRRDFPYFRRLRALLPASHGRSGDRIHFFRMIHYGLEAIAVNLLYDRLGERRWLERVTITGARPDQLPAWEKRPVILAYMHTGGYILLRSVLRSRGLPAATLVRWLPRVIAYHGKVIRARGDRLHGLAGVLDFFHLDGTSLRPLLRFLQPGRLLIIALDGQQRREELVRCEVEGSVFYLSDGVVRLARTANALLVPVSVSRTGSCRFEVRFGEAVPDVLLEKNESDEALAFLARALWRDLATDPDAIGWRPLESLAEAKVRARVHGP